MPVPAFGFSAGDFVALVSLVWKLGQALSEASIYTRTFYDTQIELLAFNGVISQIRQCVETASTLDEDQRSLITNTLQQAKTTLEGLAKYVDSFKGKSPNGNKTRPLADWKKKVSWSFAGVKKVQKFRESMQSYSSILSLALQSFNNLTMQGLDRRLAEESTNLSVQMQRCTDEIRLDIAASIEDPWDQKPIRFQDAMGRRYPIPLEVCCTVEGLLDFLKHSFKDTPLSQSVEQRSIWLFTPLSGQLKQWNLITAEDWQSSAIPGMQLGMSLARIKTVQSDDGPRSVFDVKLQATISFSKPLPPWSPYPEDAEFQYLDLLPIVSVEEHPEPWGGPCASCTCEPTGSGACQCLSCGH